MVVHRKMKYKKYMANPLRLSGFAHYDLFFVVFMDLNRLLFPDQHERTGSAADQEQ